MQLSDILWFRSGEVLYIGKNGDIPIHKQHENTSHQCEVFSRRRVMTYCRSGIWTAFGDGSSKALSSQIRSSAAPKLHLIHLEFADDILELDDAVLALFHETARLARARYHVRGLFGDVGDSDRRLSDR